MAFFYEKNYNGYDKTYESRILCAGQYYDAESGMYYLRARYYSLDLKRFTQEDTHWNTGNMIYGDNPQKSGENAVPSLSSVYQSGNLYAYCLGNPVLYVDETGMLAYPGQMHNEVVNHVSIKYGFHTEQTIYYAVGWGRADLISADGRVWDVKRDRSNQIKAGKKQVTRYTENTWKNHALVDLSVGGYISPDSFVATFNVDTYYVDYYYAGGGVIAYDYYKVTDWQKVGEYMCGIVVILGCSYVIYQSGGALAPILVPIGEKVFG